MSAPPLTRFVPLGSDKFTSITRVTSKGECKITKCRTVFNQTSISFAVTSHGNSFPNEIVTGTIYKMFAHLAKTGIKQADLCSLLMKEKKCFMNYL